VSPPGGILDIRGPQVLGILGPGSRLAEVLAWAAGVRGLSRGSWAPGLGVSRQVRDPRYGRYPGWVTGVSVCPGGVPGPSEGNSTGRSVLLPEGPNTGVTGGPGLWLSVGSVRVSGFWTLLLYFLSFFYGVKRLICCSW